MKNFIKENKLFVIAIIVTLIFVLSPLWLRCDVLHRGVAWMLNGLNDDGFKTSYIETTGAILGTFLAITGALWTQRKIDSQKEALEIKEAATIVFFDFKFAFEDIFKFEQAYSCIKPGSKNQYNDVKYFNKCRRGIKIYIDSDWIHNVAKLGRVLTREQIRQIYNIYGKLETIKIAFEKEDEEIDVKFAHSIYHMIHADLCDLILLPQIEVKHKDINQRIMDDLEKRM